MKGEFGQALSLPLYKGRIHSDYNWPGFIQAISDCRKLLDSPECQIMLEGRNRVGLIQLSIEGQPSVDVVVKEFCLQGVNKLKTLAFASKAQKAWRGAAACVQLGIQTPPPVAYLEKKGRFFTGEAYYLTLWIGKAEEVRRLFRSLPPADLLTLLEALARHMSFCHERGVLHRDLSDGNILVRTDDRGRMEFDFVDTNRVRVKKKIRPLRGVKNLIRLGIHPVYQRKFLMMYLGSPEVPRHIWCWYRTNKAAFTWMIGFKKALRLRVITQKLRIQ